MTVITGDLVTVTSAPETADHVLVRSRAVRTSGANLVTTSPTRVPVVNGKVTFTALPGPAVLAVVRRGAPVETVRMLIPEAGEATLGAVVDAARLASGASVSELERLSAELVGSLSGAGEAVSKVNAALASVDGVVAAAETAKNQAEAAAATAQDAARRAEAAGTGTGGGGGTGVAPTLTIGEVTEGEQPAAEFVAGDAEGEYRLNLTLPKSIVSGDGSGVPGPAGPAGPAGEPGAAGADGIGWIFSATNQPPAEGDWPEGTFCFTMEAGRVFRWEGRRWVYKGFIATTVQDQQIANQILNGKMTREALLQLTGVQAPYTEDYGQPRFAWAGREWVARDSSWKRGGPIFTDEWAAANAAVSGDNLVLKMTNPNGKPIGAEVVSVEAMGYGTYEVSFTADLRTFNVNAVFGAFVFDWSSEAPAGFREIDVIEVSGWGTASLLAKFTHYPSDDPVSQADYPLEAKIFTGMARMVWEPGRIAWELVDASTDSVVYRAETRDQVPTPGKQQFHINTWAFNGPRPEESNEFQVTVTGFKHVPAGAATPGAVVVDDDTVAAVVTGGEKTKAAIRDVVGELAPTPQPAPTEPAAQVVPALKKYFDPTKRYMAPVTYWWADHVWNPESNWKLVFENIDTVPFVVINPRSGAGDKVEPDFVNLLTALKGYGRPACAYIRTVTDLGQRLMRNIDDVKAELQRFKEFYGDLITGVFYDEMYNGWDEQHRDQIAFYEELYRWTKAEYGEDFLIIGNPGSPTTEAMLACADVFMSFEANPARYLEETTNLAPDWYKTQPAYRFWHAIHNVENAEQAKQLYAKANQSNVGHLYLTTDSFTMVIGSETPDNNPWDNVPAPWLSELNLKWARRQSLDGPATSAPVTIPVYTTHEEANSLPVGTLYGIAGGA